MKVLMKKDDLIRLMEARGGRITTKAAREAGFSNTLLALLEREGSVERETRGVYALTTVPLDTFAVIALRWPKAVFSHGSALYHLQALRLGFTIRSDASAIFCVNDAKARPSCSFFPTC